MFLEDDMALPMVHMTLVVVAYLGLEELFVKSGSFTLFLSKCRDTVVTTVKRMSELR